MTTQIGIDNKDVIYEILTNPTKESFRKLLKNNEYEADNIDFKETWIEKEKLVKLVLSMANNGGGIIIIGVTQNKDNTFSPSGIVDFKDRAELHRELKNYLPHSLHYDLFNFNFDSSEYIKLEHKKYQLIAIRDNPKNLPYICEKDGNIVKNGDVYIRRGTEIEKADSNEMVKLIRRNISSQPKIKNLPLEKHLEQLKILYSQLEHETPLIRVKLGLFSERKTIKEKEYPSESYNQFIANLITKKKIRIAQELDIK